MKPFLNSKKTALPIDSVIERVNDALQDSRVLLVAATPGSGKTTRVPWEIARQSKGKVFVLEPRRLAAKLSAERVAEENAVELGGREVGYHFRFEKKRTPETKLTFLTEGMLLKECLSDPKLSQVSHVVLDEFHERHLQGDVALAYLRALQKSSRPDLKLIVMSATLELQALENYFGEDVSKIEVEAPRFPIEIRHFETERRTDGREERLEDRISKIILSAIEEADSEQFGDLLVFLPGMGDIRRVEERLSRSLDVKSQIEILPLHGELTKEEQDRAVRPSKRRKVILATNIAESSLTIPGVNTVIDSGLSRVAMVAHWSGLPRLETKPISKASAIQRAGRAGRTGPGRVYRAYGKGDYEGRPFSDQAEIHRADLSSVFLELAELLQDRDFELPWFEAPSFERKSATESLLLRLGMIEVVNGVYSVTERGRRALAMPLPLRLSATLIEAIGLGVAASALPMVVALSEEEELGLDFLEGLKRYRVESFVAKKTLDRLKPLVQEKSSPVKTDPKIEEGLARALLSGFPDRVGKKRGGDLILSSGGSVSLVSESMGANALISSHDLFLALDVSESKHSGAQKGKLRVKSLVPIELDWLMDLPGGDFKETNARVFDEKRGRWLQVEEWKYGDLVLDRTEREIPSSESGSDTGSDFSTLWEAWLKRTSETAPLDERERWKSALIREKLAIEVEPDLFRGKTLTEKIHETLESVFSGVTRLSELPSFPEVYENYLDPKMRSAFEELVPEFISLPGRKKTPVLYQDGVPPRVESRMQDFFGLKNAPTILKGRKKLSLQLLAPNYRAVQVTEDLEGFWVRHYPALRKELMRRYPRHKWPENPLIALPNSNGK